jgi:hypothetical protein
MTDLPEGVTGRTTTFRGITFDKRPASEKRSAVIEGVSGIFISSAVTDARGFGLSEWEELEGWIEESLPDLHRASRPLEEAPLAGALLGGLVVQKIIEAGATNLASCQHHQRTWWPKGIELVRHDVMPTEQWAYSIGAEAATALGEIKSVPSQTTCGLVIVGSLITKQEAQLSAELARSIEMMTRGG